MNAPNIENLAYLRHAVRRVVDYGWADERKHWDESGRPAGHIFEAFHVLLHWLERETETT